MRRYRLFVALPVLALLFGCGGTLVGESDQTQTEEDRGTFHDDGSLKFAFFWSETDCDVYINPDPTYVASRCPADPAKPPPMWVTTVVCKGKEATLGAISFVGEHCSHGDLVEGGKGVFTLSTGDTINYKYSGETTDTEFDQYGRPVKIAMREKGTFDGGTGTYAKAKGFTYNKVMVAIDHDTGPFPIMTVNSKQRGFLVY
mgnify:CR=1 FL=1